MKNPDDFGDIVRSLYAFGVEVLHPKEVAVLSGTVA